MKNMYPHFALMLAASFIVMYVVMYLNVDSFGHVFLNLNRLYMTILMVAPMALIMLGVMGSMCKNKSLNKIIAGIAIAIFAIALFTLRNQTFVDDESFMNSMIPHHSSAILVSEQADLTDPEVQELARQIIKSQKEEIAQMKKILNRMEE